MGEEELNREAMADLGDDALVQRAAVLAQSDDENGYWAAVGELHRRGGETIFAAAMRLSDDDRPELRCLAWRATSSASSAPAGQAAHRREPAHPGAALRSAGHVADPSLLLPALTELSEWWDVDVDLLERARRRCDPEAQAATIAWLSELLIEADRQSIDVAVWSALLANDFDDLWIGAGPDNDAAGYSLVGLLHRSSGSVTAAIRAIADDLAPSASDRVIAALARFGQLTAASAAIVSPVPRSSPTNPASILFIM